MPVMLLILEPQPLLAGPSPLGSLNSLLFSVTLIFILVGIMSWSYYYSRMERAKKNLKGKWSGEKNGKPHESALKYAYMTKEELREMVELEKAKESHETAISSPVIASDTSGMDDDFTPTPSAGKPLIQPDKATVTDEAMLLAKLALTQTLEEKQDEAVKKPPKGYKTDNIERSAPSNELPDEFKGKSRRI